MLPAHLASEFGVNTQSLIFSSEEWVKKKVEFCLFSCYYMPKPCGDLLLYAL